jgi:hypothetical protein
MGAAELNYNRPQNTAYIWIAYSHVFEQHAHHLGNQFEII